MPITLKDNHNLEVRDLAPEQQQRRRMLIALAVLLAALIVVLVKDRQVWFPSTPPTDSQASDLSPSPGAASNPAQNPAVAMASREALPHPPPAPARKGDSKNTRFNQPAPTPETQVAVSPVIAATDRTVLPPLEVEVVAGNERRSLAPANNQVKVEMQPSTPAASSSATTPEPGQPGGSSGAHVLLSRDTSERVAHPVEPSYPLLAKQMKVQGAVVLQALIDKTGGIEDLRVISGPTILAAAAREAVKQWHFKPYFQNGQPVETEARITVNFTISTY